MHALLSLWYRFRSIVSMKTVIVAFASLGLLGVGVAYRHLNVIKALEPSSKQDEQSFKGMEQMSFAKDITYMGGIARDRETLAVQQERLKQLTESHQMLEERLGNLADTPAPPPKNGLSPAQIKAMVDAQLRQASAAGKAGTAAVPPPPRRLRSWLPPGSGRATTMTPQPKGPTVQPNASVGRAEGSNQPPVRLSLRPRHVSLPAGSFATVRGLNGFVAQSITGQTQSMALEFITPLYAPNGASVPLERCRLVAECTASDILARGLCELRRVTCTLPTGRLIETALSGWIEAEDSKNGTFADVIFNDTELLKRIGQAAIPAILAELLDVTRETTQAFSPDGVVVSETTRPAANIAERFGNLLLDRVRLFVYPIVSVEPFERLTMSVRETAVFEDVVPADFGSNTHQTVFYSFSNGRLP